MSDIPPRSVIISERGPYLSADHFSAYAHPEARPDTRFQFYHVGSGRFLSHLDISQNPRAIVRIVSSKGRFLCRQRWGLVDLRGDATERANWTAESTSYLGVPMVTFKAEGRYLACSQVGIICHTSKRSRSVYWTVHEETGTTLDGPNGRLNVTAMVGVPLVVAPTVAAGGFLAAHGSLALLAVHSATAAIVAAGSLAHSAEQFLQLKKQINSKRETGSNK